ncbi:enhanced serine sensitivity protein SseB C-terminal domain-containing protein [Sphingomonas sp.]|uniref:SseB family protein n=1 Tax=Sphingomonas sp. TaxID=28214 RepID=UPI0028A77561|nr:enhanced serine sensitivity protein SseB C-terminal domain-containing protein [Sphingomonas sp.]
MFKWLAKRNAAKTERADTEADHAGQESSAVPPRFEPQNDLERALMRAGDDVKYREHFTAMLLEAPLLFATPEAPAESGTSVIQAGESLSILRARRFDGESYPALFTSELRVAEAFGAGTGYVQLLGKTALEIVAADGAWLNPASSYNVTWRSRDLRAILGQPVPWTAEQDTQALLGTPQETPTALIARIQAIVLPDPRIESAWLALAHWPTTNSFSWYLDIRTTAPREDIAPVFAGVCDRGVSGGRELDILFQQPGGNEGQGIRIKSQTLHA